MMEGRGKSRKFNGAGDAIGEWAPRPVQRRGGNPVQWGGGGPFNGEGEAPFNGEGGAPFNGEGVGSPQWGGGGPLNGEGGAHKHAPNTATVCKTDTKRSTQAKRGHYLLTPKGGQTSAERQLP